MADTKISSMTAATTLGDTDELVLAVAGANKKITGANLKSSMPGGGGGAAWTLLNTTTLASVGSFDVSGISQAYNDLILVAIVRATTASYDSCYLSFNGLTVFVSNNEYVTASGTTVASVEQLGAAGVFAGVFPGTNAPANAFGSLEMTIYGYASTAWKKMIQWSAGGVGDLSTGGAFFRTGMSYWDNTAAINRITAAPNNGANFAVGSQLRIYGRL